MMKTMKLLFAAFALTATFCYATCAPWPHVAEPKPTDTWVPPIVASSAPEVELIKPEPIDDESLAIVERRVLIVGDSEACAVGPYARHAADRVNDLIGLPHDIIDVECKPSTTVQYWGSKGHLDAALKRHPLTDVVIVFLGTNHVRNVLVPPVNTIINLIKEHGAKCVWVGNTAVEGKRWPMNGIMKKEVSTGCNYFDTEAADVTLFDGVHPDANASIAWLKAIWITVPVKFETTDECR